LSLAYGSVPLDFKPLIAVTCFLGLGMSRMVFWCERCDRHGRELADVSPAIALERREYVGKGKGVRRNFPDLPEEG